MDAMRDIMAEAYGKAISAFLRASGGQAAVHARDFGIERGDCSRAVRRLQRMGRIERVGDCVWRLVE